jgi:hypothetical protein
MPSPLTLDQFRSIYRSGGFESVVVRASGGEFFVTAQPRSGGRVTLATTHGKRLRAFRDAGKALAVLHEIGAHKIQVDTSAWSLDKAKSGGHKRPDTAERQRRAHEAAAHDAWFRSEVEKALKEADDPQVKWVLHEDVKQRSGAKREAWLNSAGARKIKS